MLDLSWFIIARTHMIIIKPSLEDNGTYLFMDHFNASSCEKAIRFILEKNLLPKAERPEALRFVINSPGGDVNSCFALIDTVKSSKIPVHTVGLGQISSCGCLLFMAGERGYRVVTPNTAVLSHQFSWGTYGKEHELFAVVKEFTLTQRRILDHYKKCTGLSEKKIREHLLPAEDMWLSADEAVKYGLADHVVTTY
ncbi:MAG: ATP-dependent Clp protease proteolytic subunit [Verrucomicrobiaceae bacterium]|nr:MAG: ATP-dependent Clp protease proteolytic subunit [Verrucomicrobiaceae bacterium]